MNDKGKTKPEKSGTVIIVGGGVGAMQASLDLADCGFKVHMIQKDSAIGGTMVMLDKTFPTGDCSMCMISPKMVEVGRNPNIDIHVLAEVVSVEGEAGNFTVTVKQAPRFVDPEKCTGCGICEEKCPRKVTSEYEQGLSVRKAIYSLYPQALPNTRVIDKSNCIYFKKGRCKACEKYCPSNAILWEDTEKILELNAGAIILSPGLERYDPRIRQELGYGRWPNVVTSIQFERILSASGPYQGTVTRPGDGKHPKKIAWIQCVGSRDLHNANPWCSSVCCMYATKQSIIAKEHDSSIEPTIFYIDIRAFGKDFDKYVNRAKEEYGIRYQRAMISIVREEPATGNLVLRYAQGDGRLVDETFDMVVLSIGFQPHQDAKEFSTTFGIQLNDHRFPKTNTFQPVETTRTGVYVTGIYQGPKDIPETVMQGSAVAGKAMTLLGDARGTDIMLTPSPRPMEAGEDKPRIGVFVCHCGINISSVVDVNAVAEYAKTLPYVVYAGQNLFSCSQDSQENMKQVIRENRINRIVVAACSPKTHEAIFMDTIESCGVNKYLFEMANIRNQDSWVHSATPQDATEKAKELVRMAVARAGKLRRLHEKKIPVIQRGLIIGGGVAGMNAALGLADQGFEVVLVEKEARLGGVANRLTTTIEGDDIQAYLDALIQRVCSHPKIQVLTQSLIVGFSGFKGNFTTEVMVGPQLQERKIDHGIVIIATGANEYKPREFLYGQDQRVMTQIELAERLTKGQIGHPDQVVMIQCVGSRNEENPNCSRICCQSAIKNALQIKKLRPETKIYILYRDIRTYGLMEDYYTEARKQGILFFPFEPDDPPLVEASDQGLVVTFNDQMLARRLKVRADVLVLSAGMIAEDTEDLASILKLARNSEGFFVEAHVKLRPVDMATEGIFLCGTAHGPKLIKESISQALAAASRATTLLSQEQLTLSAVTAQVDQDRCAACLICVRSCPYNVPRINEQGVSEIDIALCHGCGICASECPAKAIELSWYEDEQIMTKIDALLEGVL
ncbi:MAG: CoB--CoM heterodisulfide reductase iron-sulfur subunit A family protein [Deltaproteobacteria bacterium]|nr:CoB--CoM heterodisulfide reductase iron-sulfur subunit A family protein [Deltaproteobacteria bacterium]MBW2150866.1 CoB--CoM heterodisulfide reductase iron-sulfur subunit A family protein [Deltaproteobacteria bacterium]